MEVAGTYDRGHKSAAIGGIWWLAFHWLAVVVVGDPFEQMVMEVPLNLLTVSPETNVKFLFAYLQGGQHRLI